MKNMKISIIGGGAMGGAVALGLIEKGEIKPGNITIADPVMDKLNEYKTKGATIVLSNKEAVKDADLLIIAVKPWVLPEVIEEIRKNLNYDTTEVGIIVAGFTSHDISGLFKESLPCKVSIIMPNTAMSVRESMTFIVPVNGKPELVTDIFSQLGKIKIIEEYLLPAATALASCGIAYCMRYVRAACEGGVELGFRASEAQEILTQTMAGAVALLRIPGAHPEPEIDKVTTPGGITIRGLNAMEKEGFTNSVIEGLKASYIKK